DASPRPPPSCPAPSCPAPSCPAPTCRGLTPPVFAVVRGGRGGRGAGVPDGRAKPGVRRQRAAERGRDRLRRQGGGRRQRRQRAERRRAVRRRRGPRRRRVRALPRRPPLRRLPQDAGEGGEAHRRGDGLDARPHARAGGGAGDADGQARVLPEAADAHAVRGPADDARRARAEGRDADGQPGPQRRGPAPQRGVDPGRRAGRGAGGARVDGPPDLAAGRRPPAGGTGAGDDGVGPVARAGAAAPVRRARVRAVQLARVLGLRHRRAGRHGLPQHRPRVLRARPARAADGRRHAHVRRDRREPAEVVRDRVRLPPPGRAPGRRGAAGAGVHDDVVRRRREAPGRPREGPDAGRERRDRRRQQGHAVRADVLGPGHSGVGHPRQRVRKGSAADDPPPEGGVRRRALRRVDRRVQGRPARAVELRLRRPDDRGAAAGQRRDARRAEARVGRRQPEGDERRRGESVHQQGIPQGVGGV
ncbi:MAG: Putative NADH-dependent dehydrogenase, partial [uncultured Phycisphaerae bacterium]